MVAGVHTAHVGVDTVFSIHDGTHVEPAHGLVEVETVQDAGDTMRVVRQRGVGVVEGAGGRGAHGEHHLEGGVRDVRGDGRAVPPVPTVGLHPVLAAETSGLAAVAGVVHVDPLYVALRTVALEEVHAVGLHGLRPIHQTLRSNVQAANGVPAAERLAVLAELEGLVEAIPLHPLDDPVHHGHGEGDRVLVVRGVPGLDLADALGVLAYHGGAISVWPGVELLHFYLLEVKLWVVDLYGVEAAVPHSVSASHLWANLDCTLLF
mmetsp:Transcript_33210/g.75271  ORF Transcript_33210/g.75271 Transcript_33210/m.75271 type:complete len:263 (-) Transcript_33210:51-839(-)